MYQHTKSQTISLPIIVNELVEMERVTMSPTRSQIHEQCLPQLMEV
jgi:hypothetical protein